MLYEIEGFYEHGYRDRILWDEDERKEIILRPVPEPRPVEDLTDEEWEVLRKKFDSIQYNFWDDEFAPIMKEWLLTLDEIRARPRETEKEKWVREQMAIYYKDKTDSERVALSFAETWDAAYEAGRKDK